MGDAEFGVHCLFQTEARLKNLDGIKVTKEMIAEDLEKRAEKIKAEKARKKRYTVGADVVLTPKKEEEKVPKEEEDKVKKEKKKKKIKEEKVKEEDGGAEDSRKKKKKKKKKKK